MVFNRFFARSKNRRTVRGSRRSLRMERLSARELLAADLASISGIVFNDLTDDGLTGDDPRLDGVEISLYRDGGDGLFDGGTGDDVLVDTTTTNIDGEYRFDNLEAGTYFLQQAAVAGLLQRPNESVAMITVTPAQAQGIAQTVIDTFDGALQEVIDPAVGGVNATSSQAAAEVIGGERDLFLERTSGTGSIAMEVNGSEGPVLSFTSSASGEGIRRVIYDGPDGDAESIDFTGLGGVDLTAGDAEGILVSVGADQADGQLVLTLYTDAADFSTFTLPIPVIGPLREDFILRFDDFVVAGGTGADFSNIGAIVASIEGAMAVDGTLSIAQTVSPSLQTADFANLQPLSLGDTVWADLNNDGVLDPGEPGIGGVELNLYRDVDSDGALDPSVDELIGTTTTDANGNYLFTDLLPGDYIVRIADDQFTAGNALAGYVVSTGLDPVPDPNDNQDGLNKGFEEPGLGVVSGAITLALAQEPDGGGYSNLTLDFGFEPQHDVAVDKVVLTADPVAGEEATFRITVTNNGPLDATSVSVVDTLPAGLTIVNVTPTQGTVSIDGQEITVTVGTLSPGQSETIDVVVDIPSSATGTFENDVVVSAAEDDSDLTNNTASAILSPSQVTDLSITKSGDPDPVLAEETLTYTLIVSNAGPSDATGVVVTDTLPADVTFVSATAPGGAASEVDGVVTAPVGNLAAGADATVTIIVTVNAGVSGTLVNTATVTGNEDDPNLANNTVEETTVVQSPVDLVITKDANVTSAVAGESFVYTIVVTNDGPGDATGVTVTDVLPAGLTYIDGTTTVGTISQAGGTVTVDIGNLADGQSATITLEVGVDASASGTLENTASVTSDNPEVDPDTATTTLVLGIEQVADLVLIKEGDPDPVIAGETLTYTLIVTNAGPSDASGVVVTDTLPADVTFVSATAPGGAASEADGVVTAPVGTLAAGDNATVTIVVTVNAGFAGTLVNTATVTGNEDDPDLANNTVEETTTSQTPVDLVITKDANVATAVAGDSFVYTIVVTNDGPNDATGVTVTDVLPAGVTFVEGTTTVGTLSEAAGTVTVDIGNLADGQSATITLQVDVDAGASGSLENTASVTSDNAELDPATATTTLVLGIDQIADLAISKTGQPDPVVPGETLTYTLIVSNAGPSDASGVVVTDTLPADVTFVSATAPGGAASEAGGVVTAPVGDLAAGAEATVTIVVTVNGGFAGPLVNSASVSGNEDDPDLANNTVEITTMAQMPVDLVITKDADVSSAVAGDSFVYTIVVTNEGPNDATGVTVTDVLPSGLTFLDGTTTVGTLAQAGGTVTVDIGNLADGQSATITIEVGVDAGASGSLENTATVTSDNPEIDPATATTTLTLAVEQIVDLVLTKSGDPATVIPGEPLAYLLVVTNDGPSNATGVVVTDQLPSGTTFVSASATGGINVSHASGVVTATVGNLAPGQSESIEVLVNVSPAVTSPLVNDAAVTGDQTDSDPDSNLASFTVQVTPRIDLRVAKSAGAANAVPGQTLTYTITVNNDGPSNATAVVAVDTLPSGVTFQSGTAPGGNVTANGNTVTMPIGNLAAGAQATATITVLIGAATTGDLVNEVEVSGSQQDLDPTNNTATTTTPLTPQVDLGISKQASTQIVQAGSPLTYTLTVTNAGPSTATSVEVVDTLPSGVTFVSGTGPQGSLTANGSTVTVPVGTLAPGASTTITINTTTSTTASGSLVNTAVVSSPQTDTNPNNNTTTLTTTVDPVTGVISGFVFVDADRDGVFDPGETPLAGVTVQLTGTDSMGNAVTRTTTTDATGRYVFEDLPAGTYSVAIDQPTETLPGQLQVGTGATAEIVDGAFAELGLDPAAEAAGFNFGQLIELLSKRRFLASTPT